MERTFGALCPLLVFITLSCINLLYFLLIFVNFLGLDAPKSPSPQRALFSLDSLLEETCLLLQVSSTTLTSASRHDRLVMARRLLVTAALRTGGHRRSDLARLLNRNKSQISRLYAQGEEDLQRDEVFQELYNALVPETLHA